MNQTEAIKDFISLSSDLLINLKIISLNPTTQSYVSVCQTFVSKYPKEYLNLYKRFIYKKKIDIKNYEYSIVHFKPVTNLQIEHIDIKNFDELIFNIVKEWENISQENKKTIFDYLIILNELIDSYNL